MEDTGLEPISSVTGRRDKPLLQWTNQRRMWDLNPRAAEPPNGFQNRPLKPLG